MDFFVHDNAPLESGFRFGTLVIILVIWSLIWKGMALWKAARNGSKPWYVALLVVNTVGILEILYIYYFSKKAGAQTPANPPQATPTASIAP